MKSDKNWINWTIRDGVKLPISPITGHVCNAHDAAQHVTYAEAIATGMKPAYVFTKDCGRFFIDIDHCLKDGGWSDMALEACNTFVGCYVEVSQSGEGLHIFGMVPPGENFPHGCKRPELGLELYTEGRFCAVTESHAVGDADFTPATGVYAGFIRDYFPPKLEVPVDTSAPAYGPCAEWLGPEDDDELITLACKSKSVKSVMGLGVSFKELWDGDEDKLAAVYPDVGGVQGRTFDWSQADGALCSLLAFWTGKDAERMVRLWGRSALGQRDKFRDRPDYVNRTVSNSITICGGVYRDTKREPVADMDSQPGAGEMRSGYQYLCPEDQIKYFEGCYYVQCQHKVFTPHGMLKPDQFRTVYGGWSFAADFTGQKTIRNAWTAFSESQVFTTPIVYDTCFRPDLGERNVIVTEGRKYINTYSAVDTPAKHGDPGPFLDFFRRLLPNDRDREILTSYMAAVVQYPGVKFQWAPVIQGTYGNGKSMITNIMSKCVGSHYTHKVNAQDIDNAFNSWLTEKLLIIIDEIKTPAGSKAEEMLKWIISDSRVPIMAKGRDQTTGDNRANLILCSNYRDAVVKKGSDRRYAPFFSAQQSRADIEAQGMGGDYFPRLYAWLRDDGYAIINRWLREYKIPVGMNPAVDCVWAPDTSSTEQAVACSASPFEQTIYEAIEEGVPGFQGGWLSSIALRRLSENRRMKINISVIYDIVANMGYVKHPALYNGRAGSIVAPESGRPRLYVKAGGVLCNITDGKQAVRKYCEDQGFPVLTEGVKTA